MALSKSTDFTVEGIPIVEGATHKTASKLKALDMLVKITGIDSDSKLKRERFEHEKEMDDKKYF